MSDTAHSSIHLYCGEIDLVLRCTCGELVPVTVTANPGGSDYGELEVLANDEAGYSETGSCWACELSSAAEDAADSAMRDRKARLGGIFAL